MMKPEDFSKKRFKLIPDADYSQGPISKYGSIGNLIKQRLKEGLAESARSGPRTKQDLLNVSPSSIDQITNYVTPFGGMTKNIANKVGKYFKNADIDGNDIYIPMGEDREVAINLFSPLNSTKRNLSIDAADLNKGSGEGSEIYPKVWDFAEDIGYTYRPEALTPTNELRLTANMLKYMNKRKKDAPHILMTNQQIGGKTDEPLTMDNAKSMADDFIEYINNGIAKSLPIRGTMNDQDIIDLASDIGPHNGIGQNSIRVLRDYLRDGILTIGGIDLLTNMYEQKEAYDARNPL